MATFTRLNSGSWRAQVRRKGRYVSETFLRREDARQRATDAERRIDRGGTPSPSRIARLSTFGDLIDLHITDLNEVGKSLGRSKAATLGMLKRELGVRTMAELDRERLIRFGRRRAATHLVGPPFSLPRKATTPAARPLSMPDVSAHEDLVGNVGSAIARFRHMNPNDQARVLHQQADPFEGLLVDYVRAAADAVVSLVPMMKGVKIDACEDDLTAFIQHLLSARVHFLGWSVGDQPKGGFSARGNAGERDLLITWGSTVLALIEAVVCDAPLTQDAMQADLESHFQKLLGYGNPSVFFHLTYAYIEDKAGLMSFLETCAESASPPGFTFLGRETIPHTDSRPPGFVARYAADFGEVKVVFLVLNLGQQRQRDAAQAAGVTKSRRAPKKQKSP